MTGFKLTTKINISTRKIATRELMNKISQDMRKTVRDRFRTSTGPNGEQWATVGYRSGRPLVITGSLRDSLRRSYDKNKAVLGTDDIRARLHQYGGLIQAKNKPYLTFKIGDSWVKKKSVYIRARPYIGFNQAMIERYREMAAKHVQEQLKKRLGGKE
ncbi:phage virion morphogenesis protein [Fusobacterium necrophorum subsp. funduliforme]|uniref:phage virion morphogenesis protein n=1 Tax=Fusobacterium necrophorum TaxID=859 RepID=UPI00370E9DFD